jgi:transposase
VGFPRATHFPLYRQSEIYAREGLELDRSTLGDWVGQAAWLLDPVVAKIRQHIFAAEKIHGDDTTVPVLAPGLGRTATGRLWVYVRDDRLFCGPAAPAAAYFYSPDRGAEHPTAHLASFTGFLQADGYAGFERLFNPARTKPGPITEVACLAHCRRKFYDVWESTRSPVAKEALDRIAAVYAIEDQARFAPADERVEHRRETAPQLDKFFDWSKATVVKLSGKLELAKAFRYMIDRREALTRFVTDGRLEVDNNVAENAMRGIALGRKNYLFCGSDAGGERAAAIYTLVATAKLNGLNPETYLRDILAKIADGHPINRIAELVPWRMIPLAATSSP